MVPYPFAFARLNASQSSASDSHRGGGGEEEEEEEAPKDDGNCRVAGRGGGGGGGGGGNDGNYYDLPHARRAAARPVRWIRHSEVVLVNEPLDEVGGRGRRMGR